MTSPTVTTDRIKNNAAYQKYLKVLEKVESMDLASVVREAKSLHAGRTSRTLHTSDIGPKMLTEALFKDLSYRARMVELRVNVSDKRDRLHTTVDVVRRYLMHRYGEKLGLKSQVSRRQFFDTLFREGIETMARMQSISEMLDMFIKDIDQAGYALKNAVALLQLVYKPETKI
jgi:hypothetical protein